MLALSDAALAHLALAATRIDPRHRQRWLQELAAKLDPPPCARIARVLPRRCDRSDHARPRLHGRTDGRACAHRARDSGGGRTMEIATVRITEAGRKALAARNQ